jgi:hypothetical protein
MCFLVNCSNGWGQVSPVQTMAFRRILLSFSSFVHFKIIWLIVCSSFSLQGHVEVGIILNLCVCVRARVCARICVCGGGSLRSIKACYGLEDVFCFTFMCNMYTILGCCLMCVKV